MPACSSPTTGPRRGASPRRTHQLGTVLAISLIILLVMTLLGITAMQNAVLEERMAGNLKEQNVGFQAAEAGVRLAVAWIQAQRVPPVASASGANKVWTQCSAGTKVGGASCPEQTAPDAAWLATDGNHLGYATGDLGNSTELPGVREGYQPKMVIEERYTPPLDFQKAATGTGVHYYTVSAQGSGGTAAAQARIQTTTTKVYAW